MASEEARRVPARSDGQQLRGVIDTATALALCALPRGDALMCFPCPTAILVPI